jgi:hypothetical protein
MTGALKVFYSYAHVDHQMLLGLQKHLAPLIREQLIEPWYDRELTAGEAWNAEIQSRLESSDIVIILVSADLLNSEYAVGQELGPALDLHRQGKLQVIPVVARACMWKKSQISELQVLPMDGKPIAEWSSQDAAYLSVAEGIDQAAQKMLSKRESILDDWQTSRLLRRKVIREVQRYLAQLGLYDDQIDGIPGPNTESAVVQFQRSAGITVDARIGPEVIRNLEERVMGAAQ